MAHKAAPLNAESFWWWQCSESVLDIEIPDPPASPSLINLNGFCGRKALFFLPGEDNWRGPLSKPFWNGLGLRFLRRFFVANYSKVMLFAMLLFGKIKTETTIFVNVCLRACVCVCVCAGVGEVCGGGGDQASGLRHAEFGPVAYIMFSLCYEV